MGDKPSVSPGEWISIGQNEVTKAVVCTVYQDSPLGDCEVVFLDGRNCAINQNVHWLNTHWEFVHADSGGGYADTYSRLQRFVKILRVGSGQKLRQSRRKNPPSRSDRRR